MDAPTHPPGQGKPESATPAVAASPAAAAGFKAWLPLIIAMVAMPALSYVTTVFILLPKVEVAARGGEIHGEEAGGGDSDDDAKSHGESGDKPAVKSSGHEAKKPAAAAGHGAAAGGAKHDGKPGGVGSKVSYPFGKVLVNVKDSHGSRYLLSSFTLVSSDLGLTENVDQNKDQLTDMAMTILGSKTITDLERPGSRNLIRSELITVFNSVLGKGALQEIFFTEFAIQ